LISINITGRRQPEFNRHAGAQSTDLDQENLCRSGHNSRVMRASLTLVSASRRTAL
jgi:hypothetical protein